MGDVLRGEEGDMGPGGGGVSHCKAICCLLPSSFPPSFRITLIAGNFSIALGWLFVQNSSIALITG